MRDEEKSIVLGYGESDDPLPETARFTKYRVFAGACTKCNESARQLLPQGSCLVLVCDKCGFIVETSLSSNQMHEVTFVYWCNKSKFDTDIFEMSQEDKKMLDKIERELAEIQAPHWAVEIISGRCNSSSHCVNYDCPYLVKVSN